MLENEDLKTKLVKCDTVGSKSNDGGEYLARLMKCDAAVSQILNENDDLTAKVLKCDSELSGIYTDYWKIQAAKENLKESLLRVEATFEKCSNTLLWCQYTYCGKYQIH